MPGGGDFSFTLPEGVKKIPIDGYIAAWGAKNGSVQLLVNLRMFKHHMHTGWEKQQTLENNGKQAFCEVTSNRKLKVGNEPALITSYKTPDDGPEYTDYVHCIDLWIHPGDTSICLSCQISQNGASAQEMSDALTAWEPLLIRMLERSELR